MPNFDVWYPLGISATLYSIMTLWLAVKRFVKKIRKLVGVRGKEKESTVAPLRKPAETPINYPIMAAPIQSLQMPATSQLPKNNL